MKERHRVLFKALETYRRSLFDVLEDVSPEEAELIPTGFRNNIRWNMGHTYLDQYLWILSVTKEKDETIRKWNAWFGFGTTPADFTEDTPTFHQIKALLGNQIGLIKEQYSHRLEEEHPPTDFEYYTTIEQVLVRTAFHEGMHVQAINDIKKCIRFNKEGTFL